MLFHLCSFKGYTILTKIAQESRKWKGAACLTLSNWLNITVAENEIMHFVI